jgi:hypothetical protein
LILLKTRLQPCPQKPMNDGAHHGYRPCEG